MFRPKQCLIIFPGRYFEKCFFFIYIYNMLKVFTCLHNKMTQGGWVAHLCLILCLYVDKVSCLCLVYEQLKIEIKKKVKFPCEMFIFLKI